MFTDGTECDLPDFNGRFSRTDRPPYEFRIGQDVKLYHHAEHWVRCIVIGYSSADMVRCINRGSGNAFSTHHTNLQPYGHGI